jgi:flagellar biosynthesis chaperone FliJ
MIGEKQYQEFLNPKMQEERSSGNEFSKAIDEMLFELMKSSERQKILLKMNSKREEKREDS